MSRDKDDSDDQSAKPASTLPTIYLDLRTNYATVPANALSIGFSNPSLFSALTTLRTLASLTDLTNLTTRPTLPALSSASSQSVGLQWHRIADRYVRLVGVHDQQLECWISG